MAEKEVALILNVNGAKAIKTVGELKKGIADTRAELEKTEVGTKRFDELSTAVKQAEGRMSDLNAQSTFLRDMPGPIGAVASGFHSMKLGILQGVKALGTLRGAIAATGIGLLLTAFASLQAYFTRTEEGAQKLRVVMAFLGAAVDKVADVFVGVGKKMASAIDNPRKSLDNFIIAIRDTATRAFEYLGDVASSVGKILKGVATFDFETVSQGVVELSEKFDEAKESVSGAVKSMTDFKDSVMATATEAARIETAFNSLKQASRQLGVEAANSRAEIKELNKDSEDITLSFEVRAAAAQKAFDIEQALVERRVELAQQNVELIKDQNELASTGEEGLQRLADAEIELANIRLESFEMQTTIQNKLNTIKQQQLAQAEAERIEEEERIKEENELKLDLQRQLRDAQIELIEEDRQREIERAEEDLERRLEQIIGETEIEDELRLALKEQTRQKLLDIDEKYNKTAADKDKKNKADELKREEEITAAKISVAQSLGSALGSIASAIEGESKAALTARKVLAVAQIAIDTATAIAGAISQAQSVPFPANIAAIATGVASVVAGIASAYQALKGADGVGGSAPSAPNVPSVPNAPSVNPVTTNTTELGNTDQANLAPIQAYVVETELTGTQNNVNQIESQATFGGG